MENDLNEEKLIKKIIGEINKKVTTPISIMEVCGTHTECISKYGIRSLISEKIKLISGPGCPVCVSDESFIDEAIFLANLQELIICTFGDLLKVRGSRSTLQVAKSKGADIRIVYSPQNCINIAKENKDKKVVFLSVGFETTAPIIATVIKTTRENNVNNLFFLTSLKIMEPILKKVLEDSDSKINGLILPGHVAVIEGSKYFSFIPHQFNMPNAICGFSELDIISGIYTIIEEINGTIPINTYNLYKRWVKENGNVKAKELMEEVYTLEDVTWRGIGIVPNSALVINKNFESTDARKIFNTDNNILKEKNENFLEGKKCICGKIMMGYKSPKECELFSTICNYENPVGPCMVSREGVCRIAYKEATVI
jgi:hydrogenase expression/formation protein HypD